MSPELLEESAILFRSQKIDMCISNSVSVSKQIQNKAFFNEASRMFACHHSLDMSGVLSDELINSSVEQTKRIHKLYCLLTNSLKMTLEHEYERKHSISKPTFLSKSENHIKHKADDMKRYWGLFGNSSSS